MSSTGKGVELASELAAPLEDVMAAVVSRVPVPVTRASAGLPASQASREIYQDLVQLWASRSGGALSYQVTRIAVDAWLAFLAKSIWAPWVQHHHRVTQEDEILLYGR
jgi:hypothetical protein